MGDSAEAEDPYKYEFVIPSQMPAGKYTIAWTWFNKIGNREMYMNCGPATITGEAGDDSFFDSLPDMFTANIGGSCGTPPSKDIKFPNPGAALERLNGATDAFADPTGDCGAQVAAPAAPTSAADSGSGSGSGSGSEGGSKGGSKGGSDSGSGSEPLPGGVFVTAPAGDAPAPTAPATLPAPDTPAGDSDSTGESSSGSSGSDDSTDGSEAAPAPAPAPAPAVESPPASDSGSSSGSGGSGSGSAFPAGTACSQEGYWNCIGGSSFQRCASGAWSATMALAAGTSCSGGLSENIALQRRGQPIKASRFAARMRI